MRSSRPIITLISLFAGLIFSEKAVASDAEITDRKEVKTVVTNFKSHRHDSCEGVFYYVGIATKTDFYVEFLTIDTGEYKVRVPFEIIERVTVQEETDAKETWGKSYIYTVFLSDKTEIKGGVSQASDFTGDSELGKFKISTVGVKEIIFNHKLKLKFNATPKGKYSATIELSDETKLHLNSATFVNEEENKNGCYTGKENYPSSMKFKRGESEYEIAWGKISSIVYSNSTEFKLIIKTGSEFVGIAQHVIGIEGIAEIGSFRLRVTVPFDSKATTLTF